MNQHIDLALCEMQAKLFVLSVEKGYDSAAFVAGFMNSKVAAAIDSAFNHLQWAGTEYAMERVEEELGSSLIRSGVVFYEETMYWMGYLYRYWHFYTGESSREIYKQASASDMGAVYLSYHTLSNELAIDRLKETSLSKRFEKKKALRLGMKPGCFPNDPTYRGNGMNDNFFFLSPIARVKDDEDDFNRNWVYLSEKYKNKCKTWLQNMNRENGLELPAEDDLTSFDNPDYLWLSYELNHLIDIYNRSMRGAGQGESLRKLPYARILLQATAMSDGEIYPSSMRIAPHDGEMPEYLVVFEQPFLKKYMECIWRIFDDNPQIFHEKNGKQVVDYQFRAPIYRQPPFDKYFEVRHDLPAIVYHQSIRMMLAHELAHIGCGHLDLQAADPAFGNRTDTKLSEEINADNQAICWLLGTCWLETETNVLKLSYDDLFQELSLTVFAVYLLYTWNYQGAERIWNESTIADYGHKSHLPYQLRTFNFLQICFQRLLNLGEWSKRGKVVSADGVPITPDFLWSVFDEAMQMILAYEKSLYMPFAQTERFCELADQGRWDDINKMIVAEQHEQLPILGKEYIPWALGPEPQGQAELKRAHNLWKEVRERLAANGTYCDLPSFKEWTELPKNHIFLRYLSGN